MVDTEIQFEPSVIHEHLTHICSFLNEGNILAADKYLENLETVYLTLVLSRLSEEYKQKLVAHTKSQKAARYLHELPDVQAISLVQALPSDVAANILDKLPKFEQADIVGELSAADQNSILAELPEATASVVRQLVEYDSDTAGGLMTVRFVSVAEDENVASVVETLQNNAETYSDFAVQYIYVVSVASKLLGVVPLRSLVLTTPQTRVADILIKDPWAVNLNDDLLTLHEFFESHQFVGVPVVDEEFNLKGVLRRSAVRGSHLRAQCNRLSKNSRYCE